MNISLAERVYKEGLNTGDVVLFEDTDGKPYVGIFKRYSSGFINSIFRLGWERGDQLQVLSDNECWIKATPQNERTQCFRLANYEILKRKTQPQPTRPAVRTGNPLTRLT